MCDCGAKIKEVMNSCKELENEYQNSKDYYYYLDCKICKESKEYFNKNMLYCGKCKKAVCKKCNSNKVNLYHQYDNFCKCIPKDDDIYYKCFIHEYCFQCKLKTCNQCIEDDIDDNFCKCIPKKHNIYNKCFMHVYCSQCKLTNCDKCIISYENNEYDKYCNNCPICEKIIEVNNSILCSVCYDIYIISLLK
jgi:hypothetical protein